MQRFLVVLAAVLLVGTSVFAQQTTGNLTGSVTTDGNPLPGATVTITSPNLQGTRTAVSDANGNYNFVALPPGEYTVKVELSGMNTITRQTKVTLSGTSRADADLKLSAVAEAITVTASAPATAALETTEVATNLDAKLIENLPIGRTLQATTTLAAGVNTNGPNAGAITISGAPAYDSVFMVNGAVTNENLRGQSHNLFIEDAIQETTILTGGISAEYGRFTGGVVNAITKSGGNEFSGSLRDSLTNDKWTKKTDFRDAAGNPEPDPIDKVNSVYEGTIGGRIIRDRLWFFGAGRDSKTSNSGTFYQSNIQFPTGVKERRYEVKLTGQVTPKHSLVGSYLDIKLDQTNNCFISCIEASNIDTSRSLPNNFKTAHYNGIITSNFLLEAGWSKKYFAFVGSGGDFPDLAKGTVGVDASQPGFNGYGAPVFCGFCTPETRNNKLYNLKGTYYLSSKALGTSSIVAGYERWAEQRKANNYQSGSNFLFYTYTPVAPTRDAAGVVHPIITSGDYFNYTPILQLSKGSDFATDSLFVNDKWDLNNHLTLNLGARYDKNDGKDSAGNTVAKDKATSPRLGLIYDVFGNSRVRLNASYSKYVSKIAETIGGSGSGAGNPAYIYYLYDGPDINTAGNLTTPQAFQQAFDYLFSVCPDARDPVKGLQCSNFLGAGFPGLNAKFEGSLRSPNVNEYTFGVGSLIGKGFIRGDVIHRKWNDFYTSRIDASTGFVSDPAGNKLDLALVGNTNAFNRKYDALEAQFNYPLFRRVNVGATYTYSKLKGNVTSETGGSGPVPESTFQYPEYKAYAQFNPTGYLPSDERNRGRAWVSYDLPTFVGNFNFSALERYDSGSPYSLIGTITNTSAIFKAGLPASTPAYVSPPSRGQSYYFSKRGQYNFETVNATDLALNYELPISKLRVFAQGELINAFNEQALVGFDTTVRTQRSSACKQTTGADLGKRCAAFNPFTTTPVEGVNYVKSANFGKARNRNDFQTPRTYRFSFGLKF